MVAIRTEAKIPDRLTDVVISTGDVTDRFHKAADRWRKETGMLSSVTKVLNHPSYLEIIKLGEVDPTRTLNLILVDLRDRPALWFEARKAIAKETPVSPEDRSDPKKAREAWLKWGQKKHLLESAC